MLQLDDFFYFKPTNTCCMDLIFRKIFLSTLIFTYSSANDSQIFE